MTPKQLEILMDTAFYMGCGVGAAVMLGVIMLWKAVTL